MIRVHKENSQLLLETNYQLLVSMLPDLSDMDHVTITGKNHDTQLQIDVVERTKYTTLINIVSNTLDYTDFLPRIKLNVRMYHDAHVAEVLTVQGHRRIKPHYSYPNDDMYLPDEKKQSNRLLAELLLFCRSSDCVKTYLRHHIEINN